MRLSVHMLVLNGEAVVGRAVRSLAGVADEVVYVDSGSIDGTTRILADECAALGIVCRGVALDVRDDNLFFTDEPSTWWGKVPGSFTGQRVLRRWDLARNVGLDLCRGDYIFKLDADDEVLDRGGLDALLRYLDADRGVSVVMAPYEVMRDGEVSEVVMYDRLWRSSPEHRFMLPIHEYVGGKISVAGKPNWTMVARGLRVRDWRDSPGEGVRIPYRNYKVWRLEYERRCQSGEDMDSRFLLSAIGEVEEVDPGLAAEIRSVASQPSR